MTLPEPSLDHRRGVLLFNLGGPESLEEVRPFLYNLFSDPDIIRIKNDRMRKALAWFIAFTRQRKSRELYRQIGGGSPLRRITEEQAAALRDCLSGLGVRAGVFVGMRCWNPTIDEAVAQIAREEIRQLVVLPLFPQYSFTTTGSCFNHLRKVLSESGIDRSLRVSYVEAWHEEPLYIESMEELIRHAMEQFPDPNPAKIHLLYSAHSIPARYVAEGDPYLTQTQRTVDLINERLGRNFPSTLAFQSKVGPVKWLEPSTAAVLSRLGKSGTRQVLVVPVSFVSDHIETLKEIDILYNEMARGAGIAEFHRAPSLNLHPRFIDALASLSLGAFRKLSTGAGD